MTGLPGDSDFRVELPQYSGPLELLLHLLDQEELTVGGIEVSRVCERYLAHLGTLAKIDIDAAGDFLVMASTLMRLKSQSLLPAEERVLEDDDLDPRFELVRQLIEYRRFRKVAVRLDELREQFQQRVTRGMRPEAREFAASAAAAPIDAGGVTVDTLFAAFTRLLQQTQGATWVIARDDTPMEAHVARLEALLLPGAEVSFPDLFGGRRTRAWVVGVFLALLELIKRGLVLAVQEEDLGEIRVHVRQTPPEGSPRGPGAGATAAAAPPSATPGDVSARAGQESDDGESPA